MPGPRTPTALAPYKKAVCPECNPISQPLRRLNLHAMDLNDPVEAQLILMSMMSMDSRGDDMTDSEMDALVQEAFNNLPPFADPYVPSCPSFE